MFAGVDCFSIIIVKRVPSAKVYSIDVNPNAYHFMEENIRLNRMYGKIVPILGDATSIIESHIQGFADCVLMPLPEKALEYLPAALSALKGSGGWVHVHFFEYATKSKDLAEKIRPKLKQTFDAKGIVYEIPIVRVVRSAAPNWWQLAAGFQVC